MVSRRAAYGGVVMVVVMVCLLSMAEAQPKNKKKSPKRRVAAIVKDLEKNVTTLWSKVDMLSQPVHVHVHGEGHLMDPHHKNDPQDHDDRDHLDHDHDDDYVVHHHHDYHHHYPCDPDEDSSDEDSSEKDSSEKDSSEKESSEKESSEEDSDEKMEGKDKSEEQKDGNMKDMDDDERMQRDEPLKGVSHKDKKMGMKGCKHCRMHGKRDRHGGHHHEKHDHHDDHEDHDHKDGDHHHDDHHHDDHEDHKDHDHKDGDHHHDDHHHHNHHDDHEYEHEHEDMHHGGGYGTHVHIHLHTAPAGDREQMKPRHHEMPPELPKEYLYARCDLVPNRELPRTERIRGSVHLRQMPGGPLEVKIVAGGFPVDPRLPVVSRYLRGSHGHTLGDTSNNCMNQGGHYNPHGVNHGGPEADVRHPGDFGNLVLNENGYLRHSFNNTRASLFGHHSMLGRGIVIHEGEDDLGLKDTVASRQSGNAGGRIACCAVISAPKPAAVWR